MKTTIPGLIAALCAGYPLISPAAGQDKDTSAADPTPEGSPGDTPDRSPPINKPDRHAAPADDKDFVHKAAIAGTGEVKLAQLGVSRAQDEKVKECAQMLVKDHTTANEELKAIAENLKVRLDGTPDPAIEKIYEELNQKSGKEFDKAFLQEMATCHERGISLFEAGKKVAKEKQVAAFIEKTLPVLRTHAEKIAEIGGWETPRLGPRPKPVVDPVPGGDPTPGVDRSSAQPQPGTNKR